jgi:tRNA U38,U39,U40 pseudouridine synthase TruA
MEIICPVFAGDDTRTNQKKKDVVEKKKSDKTKDLWVIGKMEITAIKFMKPEVRKVMTIMLLLQECLFLLVMTMSFYRQNVIKSL